MNKVLLFAGTTEGKEVAEFCKGKNIDLTVSVATEYGEATMTEGENIKVISGRKDAEAMDLLLAEEKPDLVIDATHPYATEVTRLLHSVCKDAGTEYLRVLRTEELIDTRDAVFVDDTAGAVSFLNTVEGSALLTTGSKELPAYTAVTDYKTRLYARILPLPDGIGKAAELGFDGKHLIGMQGPFSEEINIAMMKMLNVQYMVTKDTGTAGGFPEKIRAAKKSGVIPVIIRRPQETEEGVSAAECCRLLGERFGLEKETKKQVTVIGCGMGSIGTLTFEADEACRNADLIVGAKRLVESLSRYGKPSAYAIAAKDIEDIIRKADCERIVVAMSGDTGFYSGTKTLLPLITDLKPEVLPGISSIIYFCSRCGKSWDDGLLISTHGRSCNFVAKIKRNKKVFALTGGDIKVKDFLSALAENGLGNVQVTVGENLSYDTERITCGTAEELAGREFDSLAVLCAENPDAEGFILPFGLPDEAFLRAEVPMTKQEIRAVTIAKLELTKNAVCWDVGAGTGSVTLEMAGLSEDGHVYAVEQKEAGCDLIKENMRHLGITNVTVVCGKAPEALESLPAPTHVFVGGSSGNLRQILEAALAKNPGTRIVLNAVTAETIAEAVDVLKELSVSDPDIVQLSAARGRKLGRYHLMTAINPVFIISCTGGK